jgi:hypothetical protein
MNEEVTNDTTGAAVWQDGSILILLAELLKLIYLNGKLNASFLIEVHP